MYSTVSSPMAFHVRAAKIEPGTAVLGREGHRLRWSSFWWPDVLRALPWASGHSCGCGIWSGVRGKIKK